jgi:hypothetical protein
MHGVVAANYYSIVHSADPMNERMKKTNERGLIVSLELVGFAEKSWLRVLFTDSLREKNTVSTKK